MMKTLEEYIGKNYYYITDDNSKIFGALDYSIDSLRNQTSYVYNANNGQLELIGYSDHSAVIYTYDEMGRLEKVSPGSYTYTTDQKITYTSSDVDYSYNDSNLLEKITTDSTEYTISYNTYNEESGISNGDRTLATYEYYPNNGKLKKINYGNGFSEEYVYNSLEMLSEIWYTIDGTRELAYNPFRYRGYYYDTDLGMYYLQSRYYDAKICRFISPDHADVIAASPTALTDKNLYAYCDNNPVMRVDGNGEFWNILIGAGIGAVMGFVSSVVSQLSDEDFALTTLEEFWAKVGVSVVGGAISGGLAASGVGIIGQIAVNAVIGGGSSMLNVHIEDVLSTKEVAEGAYFLAALNGTLMGVASGIIGGPGSASKHVSNSFWRMVSSGGRNLSYYFSQINTQAVRDGLKAISSIIKAAIPSVTESVVHLLNQPVR